MINSNWEQNAFPLHNRKENSNFKNNWSCPSNMTYATKFVLLDRK